MKHVAWSMVVMGCVGNDAPDEMKPVAFTNAQATVAGEALTVGIEEAAKRYGPIAPQSAAGCVTTSGDASDPDNDTIPTSAKLAYDCSKRRLGFTGTVAGTESVSDDEPNNLAWAFTAAIDLQASLTGPFGGSVVVDTDGSVVASHGSSVGPFRLRTTLDVITAITNTRSVRTDVTESLDWNVSYTPNLQWAPGGIVVTGSIATDGVWNVTVDDNSLDASVATPEALVVTPSCETRITAGVVEATFVGSSLTVRWSGCGQSDVMYVGPAAN